MAKVILSTDHVEAWRDEMATLYKQRGQIEMRLSELDELINMAEALAQAMSTRVPEDGDRGLVRVGQSEVVGPPSLTEAIKSILMRERRPMTKKEIRIALGRDPAQAERVKSNPAYFYTALKRLRDRGDIIKDGKRERIAGLQIEAPMVELPFTGETPPGAQNENGEATASPDTEGDAPPSNENRRAINLDG